MKKILLYLVTFSPAGVWAQQKAFTMEGTLKNSVVNGKYVYLAYNGKEGNKLDSAEIVANKYSFKGELSQPGNAMLFNTSPMTMAGRNPKSRVSLTWCRRIFRSRMWTLLPMSALKARWPIPNMPNYGSR